MSSPLRRYVRPLVARDPTEPHRVATPLELLTDLRFVVAVSQAASAFHHQISDGRVAHGVTGFAMAFFATFWAWLNFTWFSSAYDDDGAVYRLLTILQIVGSLMLAAGIPKLLDNGRPAIAVLGYIVMRIALVTQWLRAAAGDPERRTTALRYATGVVVVQFGWVAYLFVPHSVLSWWFLGMVVAELAVPIWAESAGLTTWHPHHVAERYSLFFIIVLGECILSTTVAIQQSIDAGDAVSGFARVIIGGVMIVFSLWWLYFSRDDAEVLLGRSTSTTMIWGFGHYFIFAATAAIGAGLAARVDHYTHHGAASGLVTAWCLTIPVAVIVAVIYVIHLRRHDPTERTKFAFLTVVVLILAGSFTPAPELIAGLVCALLVAVTARVSTALAASA
ncbi:MAG: low temperature requirement protein A [Jatrophihabitans sp.]